MPANIDGNMYGYVLSFYFGTDGLIIKSTPKKESQIPSLSSIVSFENLWQIENLEQHLGKQYFVHPVYMGNGHCLEISRMYGDSEIQISHKAVPERSSSLYSVSYKVEPCQLAKLVEAANGEMVAA